MGGPVHTYVKMFYTAKGCKGKLNDLSKVKLQIPRNNLTIIFLYFMVQNLCGSKPIVALLVDGGLGFISQVTNTDSGRSALEGQVNERRRGRKELSRYTNASFLLCGQWSEIHQVELHMPKILPGGLLWIVW